MKLFTVVLAFLAAAGPLSGRDVLQPEVVAPGLLYARYEKGGVIAHVLKMELKEKGLRLRSVKAHGKETVRQMVARMNQEVRVVGAINGDFFRQETAAGIPYGGQVSDGRLIFAPMRRALIAFGPDNEPHIDVVNLKAKICFEPKAQRGPISRWPDLNGINIQEEEETRLSGIYLYTPAFLAVRSNRPHGLIAVVEQIQPALQVGDLCEGTVARIETGGRHVEVPEAGCLLYFFGETGKQAADKLKPGQPVALKIELPPIAGHVAQAIGGGPRLMRDGKKYNEINKESFEDFHRMEISSRHPRAAIGYDRLKQNLFLVMVEGRHPRSRGMTFGELSTFLADLGCYQAMAFDGGGSAGIYVGGKGMVSLASGMSEERAIANGLLITLVGEPRPKEPAGKGAAPPSPKEAQAGSQARP
jgi:hypothetical protein